MHARLDAGRVNILTRRGNDWTEKYPTIAEAIAALPAQNAYLDGELCGVLPDGTTAFNLIQNASDTGEGALVFFLFDLLFLDGENLLTVPLLDRKARLASLLTSPPDRLQYNDHQIRPRSGLSPLGLRTRPRRRRVEAHQREVRARSALLAEDQVSQPGGICRCRMERPRGQPSSDRVVAARLLHAGWEAHLRRPCGH